MSLFGYYDRTSEKELGKRIQLDMFDTSLQLQMHIWEGLYARVGVYMPINGTLTLQEMDDRTKEELQGGSLIQQVLLVMMQCLSMNLWITLMQHLVLQ